MSFKHKTVVTGVRCLLPPTVVYCCATTKWLGLPHRFPFGRSCTFRRTSVKDNQPRFFGSKLKLSSTRGSVLNIQRTMQTAFLCTYQVYICGSSWCAFWGCGELSNQNSVNVLENIRLRGVPSFGTVKKKKKKFLVFSTSLFRGRCIGGGNHGDRSGRLWRPVHRGRGRPDAVHLPHHRPCPERGERGQVD